MLDALPDFDLVAVEWRGDVYAVRSSADAWRAALVILEAGRPLGGMRVLLTPESAELLNRRRPSLGDLEELQAAMHAAIADSTTF